MNDSGEHKSDCLKSTEQIAMTVLISQKNCRIDHLFIRLPTQLTVVICHAAV